MKKSQAIVLTAIMAAAIASCASEKQWIWGYAEEDCPHDTIMNGEQFRFYEGRWYPVYHDMINPDQYRESYYAPHHSSGGSFVHYQRNGFGGSARMTVAS